MTTSPVVLARTFTDKDIIVANNHSKSVLRAVAGEVSDECARVDYFPSYEIATIGPREQVWDDDLIHVKSNFVARIMQHVTGAYVPGSVTDTASELTRMANLVDVGEFDRAGIIYDTVGEAARSSSDPAIHAASIRLAIHRDDSATAVSHALHFEEGCQKFPRNPEWVLEAARALSTSEEHRAVSERMLTQLESFCRARPGLLQALLVSQARARDDEGLRYALDLIERSDVDHPALVQRASKHLQQLEEPERALALLSAQLVKRPDEASLLESYARILLREGRPQDAISPLEKLVEQDWNPSWARFALARALYKDGRNAQALEAVEAYLELKAADPEALAFQARTLRRLGQNAEAADAARAAIEASDRDPRIMKKVEGLLVMQRP